MGDRLLVRGFQQLILLQVPPMPIDYNFIMGFDRYEVSRKCISISV
ncbi:hypothetical protein ADICYQ_5520 [Cyclobacterium qasimii M12-11B]|uniref:Uncharacterized protein n=1 Tax=Cyclobacterium qasimii M12-11B TaxID=641524 RepID=S7WFS4_9BACT|nr:hypothetical protein ADICYQ_5520 [Cyclobacterium qasimii M12-11B]